jgi:very-short-patch-repair endonuclease
MVDDGFDSAQIVIQWLQNHGFTGFKEQAFQGLMGDYTYLRFDIWIPDYNLCIEVDGQQHYQACKNDSIEAFLRKREYARRKEFYCLQHGMRLVRVVYDELNYLDQTFAFLLQEKEDRQQPVRD